MYYPCEVLMVDLIIHLRSHIIILPLKWHSFFFFFNSHTAFSFTGSHSKLFSMNYFSVFSYKNIFPNIFLFYLSNSVSYISNFILLFLIIHMLLRPIFISMGKYNEFFSNVELWICIILSSLSAMLTEVTCNFLPPQKKYATLNILIYIHCESVWDLHFEGIGVGSWMAGGLDQLKGIFRAEW